MSDYTRKDLPAPSAPNYNQRVRETLMTFLGRQGSKLDRGLTLRDMLASGLVKFPAGFNPDNIGAGSPPLVSGPSASIPYELDLTPPPMPTGFAVSAAISNVFIETAAPVFSAGHGYLRTHVYGKTWSTPEALPTFGTAVEITSFTGAVFAHPTNPATTWHLWVTWESADGVESPPAGGTNGLSTTTGQDVTKLVQAMTGPGNPFTILPMTTVVGGVTFPAGTYSTQAFILDAQITNAKIANLAVDDAKIANLSVSKLEAGSLKVGSYISSANYVAGSQGFAIWATGLAEFNNVVVRGTVYANAGLIGGNTINATGIQSPGYIPNTNGWHLNSDGTLRAVNCVLSGTIYALSGTIGGNTIDATGIQSPGYSPTQGYRLDSSGIFKASGYSGTRVIDMAATGTSPALKFAGLEVLGNGTTTFGGLLTAQAIDAVNTINIAGNAVVIPVGAIAENTVTVSSNEADVLSAYINPEGGKTFVVAEITGDGGSFYTNESGTTFYPMTFRLKRNGVVIRTTGISGVGTRLMTTLDQNGSAATWTLSAVAPTNNPGQVTTRLISLIGAKR